MKDHPEFTVHCYSGESVLKNTEDNVAYKIIEFVSGGGFARIGHYVYILSPGDLVFLHPDTRVYWELKDRSVVHYCQIRPEYIGGEQYLVKLFGEHPQFSPSKALITLTFQQALAIGMVFKMMRQEVTGVHDDKKQAILLHAQMVLFLAKRADNYRQKYF